MFQNQVADADVFAWRNSQRSSRTKAQVTLCLHHVSVSSPPLYQLNAQVLGVAADPYPDDPPSPQVIRHVQELLVEAYNLGTLDLSPMGVVFPFFDHGLEIRWQYGTSVLTLVVPETLENAYLYRRRDGQSSILSKPSGKDLREALETHFV
jgi:hypothetical protein